MEYYKYIMDSYFLHGKLVTPIYKIQSDKEPWNVNNERQREKINKWLKSPTTNNNGYYYDINNNTIKHNTIIKTIYNELYQEIINDFDLVDKNQFKEDLIEFIYKLSK